MAGASDKSLFNMFDPSRNKYLSVCQFNLATLAAAVMTVDDYFEIVNFYLKPCLRAAALLKDVNTFETIHLI